MVGYISSSFSFFTLNLQRHSDGVLRVSEQVTNAGHLEFIPGLDNDFSSYPK